MRLGEEIVGVHGSGQHRGKIARAGVGLDGCSQHHHVGGDEALLVVDQVAALHHQFAVLLPDLADHALDVLHAVLLHRAAVELVEVLAGVRTSM